MGPFFQIHSILETAMLFYAANPCLFVLVAGGLVYMVYYVLEVVGRPILACREGKFKKFLLKNCPILQQRYWPTVWCFGTHGQTALANMIRGHLTPNLKYRREMINFTDGGVASLDWLESSNYYGDKTRQPIALFLPGLTGDSQTEYVKSMVVVAQRVGCRCVIFNNRGRGGVKLRTPKMYCAVITDDLEVVLKHIHTTYPNSPILATGISMGGIILGQYLVKLGSEALVTATLLISVPWDIHETNSSMKKFGLNKALNFHLAQNMRRVVEPYKELFEQVGINMTEVLQARTIEEFDNLLTAKLFGFASAHDYYTAATLKGKLQKVQRPTLCVNAADDMFAPIGSLPQDEIRRNGFVAMVITSRGGHIGFMEGFVPILPFFSERLYEQYIGSLVEVVASGRDILRELSY